MRGLTKLRLITAALILLCCGRVASAHRLDEYLQATILSVEKDHVNGSMRLIPGVAVSAAVIASIDSNGDGVISQVEQRAYAERVLGNLSLTIDGNSLALMLVSAEFPQIEQIREGVGEIHIEFTAELPLGGGNRSLVLENHNQNEKAVYLVNCLVPGDHDIRIVSQTRNQQQSRYQLDYVQDGASESMAGWWTKAWWASVVDRTRDLVSAAGIVSLYRLGMRHIAEGTDHLLFLLTLFLPAPLIAYGPRWAGVADVRSSLYRILKAVTAFTVGHSITLALAAFGVVHVPNRPIEALIAVSILVSAIHALRPIFPGREAWIAAFFGLIHGLAFAAKLSELGLGRWERVGGVLAFNLGIESMQLIVVAVTLPSLLLMSRTRAYPFWRIGGALFAGSAAVGWMAERILGLHTSVDLMVNSVAHHGVWIAGALFLMSLGCWRMSDSSDLDRSSRVAEV